MTSRLQIVFADAQSLLGEILASEELGPIEAEHFHERLASVARGDADLAARRNRVPEQRAHRSVDRAEEELQVFAASHFDEGEELVDFEPGLLLVLVV